MLSCLKNTHGRQVDANSHKYPSNIGKYILFRKGGQLLAGSISREVHAWPILSTQNHGQRNTRTLVCAYLVHSTPLRSDVLFSPTSLDCLSQSNHNKHKHNHEQLTTMRRRIQALQTMVREQALQLAALRLQQAYRGRAQAAELQRVRHVSDQAVKDWERTNVHGLMYMYALFPACRRTELL